MTTPTPSGWRIWSDRGWMHFTRPDGFTQAVTDHEPHLSHAETLHMLLQALAAQAPAQQAAQPVVDHACTPTAVVGHEAPNVRDKDAQPVAPGSWAELKLAMEHSAFDGRLELSDALANIDDFAASAAAQPVATVQDCLTVAQPVAGEPVAWTPGPNVWKDWCSQWFGPDADDAYLARAVYALPPMAQRFAYTAAPAPVGLTDEQADSAVSAWFGLDADGIPKDAGPGFRARMRAAFAAVGIKAGKGWAA